MVCYTGSLLYRSWLYRGSSVMNSVQVLLLGDGDGLCVHVLGPTIEMDNGQ